MKLGLALVVEILGLLNMIKVALIYKKSLDGFDFITKEYTDIVEIKQDDRSREYGRYVWLEDAIEDLAEVYPDGEEFIIKLIGFKGKSK